jgi:RNA recognition motif-containing protein
MNIYVGNLSWASKDDTLREAFESFGEVSSAKVITDRETSRSKGFGFVEMPNDDEATVAIERLNGTEPDGRVWKVNEARPRRDNGR